MQAYPRPVRVWLPWSSTGIRKVCCGGALALISILLVPPTTSGTDFAPGSAAAGARALISNVEPRRDTENRIVNAHAGGIYNFSGTFYLLGEHYRSCPHAGSNRTVDPLAVGNCEMCGHTGTTFALYTSKNLKTWHLNSSNVIPNKPGGPDANLYTPVLAYNAQFRYFVMMYQCSGGCQDGQLQVATAASPAGPFQPRGTVLPHTDPRSGSSQGGIWVDESTQTAYLIFNSIGDAPVHGQWIVELDETYLRMTNRSAQIATAGPGSESGWLEGGGIFKRDSTYYYMAGSGCCYCAGGGGAMVFTAPHPLGPWTFQTNVNDALYLPFSPRGEPPPPPPLPFPVSNSSETCSNLSGKWAMSVLTPNYQPLRAGLTVTKIPPPPPPSPLPVITISTPDNRCLQFEPHRTANSNGNNMSEPHAVNSNQLVSLGACSPRSAVQRWILKPLSVNSHSFRTTLITKTLPSPIANRHVRLVHEATGQCLDGALGKPGRLLYVHGCVPEPAVGQTWKFQNETGNGAGAKSKEGGSALVNVAARTCVAVGRNSSIGLVKCAASPIAWQNWNVASVPRNHSARKETLTYYNLTSTSETHWPAVPSSGWLLQVNELKKTVAISTYSAVPGATPSNLLAGTLQPWVNPWANGQQLPAAPGCTMISTTPGSPTLCKLPYCGARGPVQLHTRSASRFEHHCVCSFRTKADNTHLLI